VALVFATLLTGGCDAAADEAGFPSIAGLERELAAAPIEGPRPAGGARCRAFAARAGGVLLPPGGALILHVDAPPRAAQRLGRVVSCGREAAVPARPREVSLLVEATTDQHGSTRAALPVPATAAAVRLPRAGGPTRLELSLPVGADVPVVVLSLELGGRAGGTSARRQPTLRASVSGRPNLLVYLVDALRRDALGVYGGPAGVSPHLDRLAAEGVVFEDAVAQAPWTRAAVASLFTGIDPAGHRVLTHEDALSPDATTLAELLGAAGYRTAAFVGNANVSGKVGFRQGFERMRQKIGPRDFAPALSAELLAWLDETAADPRPFFAYVHAIDPHGPYLPPEPFRSRFAPGVPLDLGTRRSLRRLESGEVAAGPETPGQLRALYNGEVAANDEAFGRLRGELARRGLWKDTAVLVLADHGEEFLEHGGLEHGHRLHVESLAIPMLLRVPGAAAGVRSPSLAQQVDVLPTLLELAGLPPPAGIDGRSLLRDPDAAGPAPASRSFARTDGAALAAVTTSRYRLIVTTGLDGTRTSVLYDRRRDPGERRDVADRHPVAAAYLESVLRWPRGSVAAAAAPRLEAEDVEQLRALGYVD
jgi:arylsulfatase A-like enzyme